MKHPIQPTETDQHGTLRFKKNAIVEYLLDNGRLDLNDIACKDFSNDDRNQFAQLIGYSLSGYGSLSYATNEVYSVAEDMHSKGLTEEQARIEYLQGLIDEIKSGLLTFVPDLFEKHPDDFTGEDE